MTALVASEPPVLPDDDGPRPGAAALAVLLHVLVAVLIILATRLMPAPDRTSIPEEQTIDVVLVPATRPPPEPLNLAEDAEIGDRSTVVAGAREPDAEAPENEVAPQRTQIAAPPTPFVETAVPPPAPVTRERTAPVPPTPAVPSSPAAQTPPPAAPLPSVTSPVEQAPAELAQAAAPRATAPQAPVQQAAVPRPVPARPVERPAVAPLAPRPRGDLGEIDLFGGARQRTQQAASPTRASPAIGPRSMTQEGVFLLRQVLRIWRINYRDPRYEEIILTFNMQLQADGTLGYPWGRNDPWQPQRMIENLAQMPPELRQIAVSFAYTLKMGQPYNLPSIPLTYPRTVSLSFRLGDL